MSDDKILHELETEFGLPPEFVEATLAHAESHYGNKFQSREFVRGAFWAFGFFKRDLNPSLKSALEIPEVREMKEALEKLAIRNLVDSCGNCECEHGFSPPTDCTNEVCEMKLGYNLDNLRLTALAKLDAKLKEEG